MDEAILADAVKMAAHDFLNCLTSMQACAKLGSTPDLSPAKREEYAHLAFYAGERARALVEDLLQLADGKELALRRETFALPELVRETASSIAPLFAMKGVALETEIAPGVLSVSGDRGKLARVLSNLLSNALKFTPSGGRVAVRLERRAGRAAVGVQDDGIGIAAEQQARIFDKFYQVDPHNHGSMGLGLYIAREILRAHGGDIHVESAGLGRGARFWFELPLLADAGL